MKKFVVVCMFVFLMLGLGANSHAALKAGTYDLLTALGNGSWSETKVGGNHGVPGNEIIATGYGWAISATLLAPGAIPLTPVSPDYWQYQTTYNVKFSVTIAYPSLWGEDIYMQNALATNLSKNIAGQLAWHFTFTGYDMDNPSIPIIITAQFDSITPNPSDATYNDYSFNHTGTNLSQLRMQVVPIPAAVWLLGSGLLGLVVIRRRMKK
jgi:hypothetical protein